MSTEPLQGKKIAVLMESDYYENEIHYYEHRFPEEGLDLHFLTRLWGQPQITFTGHEMKTPMTVSESFEDLDDAALAGFAAVIVPSGMVADRLRYTEDVAKIPPATEFLARAFAAPSVLVGIICHGLWLTAPRTDLVKGRPLTCHNNLIGDAKAYGAAYQDADLVIDGDLITARTGGHCHLLAKAIIETLKDRA
ncbi:thiamine biosynthesis protein ThiJ [Roseospira marina]|uniref:Thiamine biosynthesis protein ThiJ n=1 Tax=Roseospira marina TaxID=140057 RepID=A0A5M6I748_9PROT|nr:DJ-1/PfpI family protein [Roseospira marina]KAA5604090.1 thiamine biosynthesis protein ThiJ [Roseospira marina]MBB4315811.1 protease I [Roseospira marina]MBB5088950.1 protease I [Roseospira marina]